MVVEIENRAENALLQSFFLNLSRKSPSINFELKEFCRFEFNSIEMALFKNKKKIGMLKMLIPKRKKQAKSFVFSAHNFFL